MKTVLGSSLALVALLFGCGGGSGGTGQCVAGGGGCSISAQCCSKICDTMKGTCMATVNNNPDMAMMQMGNPDLTMGQMCQPEGGNCNKPADCCNGIPCTMNSCKKPAQLKKFGESCTAPGDCETNICVGIDGVDGRFCSAACNRTTDCTALSANPAYYCIAGGGGVNFCVRTCTKSADCTGIGPDWSCDNMKNIENLVSGICGVYQELVAGAPCKDNAQCSLGACNTIWCADPCANDAACGASAACLLNNNQAYTCFPTCTSNNDCTIFGQGGQLTCKAATTRQGAMVKVCSG